MQRQVLRAERRDVLVAASTNAAATSSRRATPGSGRSSPRNGPDGALYIVDMYRRIIDHPQYVPEQSRALLDFEAGKERGRIYRVVASDWKRDRQPVDLGRMTRRQLARTLEHPNAWWRETAQRLLVERRDRTAHPGPARRCAQPAGSEVARVHALWTLDGLAGLEAADVVSGARTTSTPASARTPCGWPRRASRPLDDLLSRVLRLVDDADDRVRLRVALALGETRRSPGRSARSPPSRGRDGAQPWMRAAILSSVRDRASEFIRAFLESPAVIARREGRQ